MRMQGSARLCGLVMVAVALGACSPEGDLISAPARVDPAAESRLRAHFPEQAARVLEARGFVTGSAGFVLSPAAGPAWAPAAPALRAELPAKGDQAVRLHAGDLDVRVREVSAAGEGSLIGEAVAYRRAGGTAFWTAAPAGVEEWLHLEAGEARAGEAVAAWEIEGASLRESGAGVDVLDAAGAAQIRVTAPAAYAAGGRAAFASLRVRANRIELTVDARGEEVLVDPLWVATGTMSTGRQQHTATLLAGGKVLVTGGYDGASYLPSTEAYAPAMSSWSAAAPMLAGRGLHTATSIAGGKVLVAGGLGAGGLPLTSAELYDPANDAWTAAAAMSAGRSGHSATLLSNGRVLVAGGSDGSTTLASVELYDAMANAWLPAAPMGSARGGHAATLLGSGKVLVTGGTGAAAALASAELYDPATDTWTPAAPMSAPRSGHTATSLANGKILVASGYDGSAYPTSAELYDPATNGWAPAGALSIGRAGHVATLLAKGEVLVEGGSNSASHLSNVDIYNPTTGSWAALGPMTVPRSLHTATLLTSGKVLVAGGGNGSILASAELFLLLSGAPCAALSDCQSGFCVDGVCCDSACNAGSCDACSKSAGAPSDGTCALLTGPVCDDGDTCTTADTCQAGQCAGTPIDCTTSSSSSSVSASSSGTGGSGGAGGVGGMGGMSSSTTTGNGGMDVTSSATGAGGNIPIDPDHSGNFYTCSSTPGHFGGSPSALFSLGALALLSTRRRSARARARA